MIPGDTQVPVIGHTRKQMRGDFVNSCPAFAECVGSGHFVSVNKRLPVAFVDIDPRKIGSTRRGRPIIGAEVMAAHRGAFVVVAVGVPKARDEIRGELARLGWGPEGEAYVFAA